MEVKALNEVSHATTAASPQKKPYESPLLQVYGAVHQFTQGSGGLASDGGAVMTMM